MERNRTFRQRFLSIYTKIERSGLGRHQGKSWAFVQAFRRIRSKYLKVSCDQVDTLLRQCFIYQITSDNLTELYGYCYDYDPPIKDGVTEYEEIVKLIKEDNASR